MDSSHLERIAQEVRGHFSFEMREGGYVRVRGGGGGGGGGGMHACASMDACARKGNAYVT